MEKNDKKSVRSRNEQRVNIKFCVKLGKTPSETYQMIKEVYGDSCMSKVSAIEWHRKFRNGREDVTDIPRPGRPTRQSDENIKKVNELLLMDQSLSNQEIAKQLNISRETVRRIISVQLKMKKPKKVKGDKKAVNSSTIQPVETKLTTNETHNSPAPYYLGQNWQILNS